MNSAFDIVDQDGEWFQSKAMFPLIDPNSRHRFVSGRTVKIKRTAWIDMQVEARAFVETDDPLKAVPPALTQEPPPPAPQKGLIPQKDKARA